MNNNLSKEAKPPNNGMNLTAATLRHRRLCHTLVVTRCCIIDCITRSYHLDYTRCISICTLGRHATIALMMGCEALPTMYRNG